MVGWLPSIFTADADVVISLWRGINDRLLLSSDMNTSCRLSVMSPDHKPIRALDALLHQPVGL